MCDFKGVPHGSEEAESTFDSLPVKWPQYDFHKTHIEQRLPVTGPWPWGVEPGGSLKGPRSPVPSLFLPGPYAPLVFHEVFHQRPVGDVSSWSGWGDFRSVCREWAVCFPVIPGPHSGTLTSHHRSDTLRPFSCQTAGASLRQSQLISHESVRCMAEVHNYACGPDQTTICPLWSARRLGLTRQDGLSPQCLLTDQRPLPKSPGVKRPPLYAHPLPFVWFITQFTNGWSVQKGKENMFKVINVISV